MIAHVDAIYSVFDGNSSIFLAANTLGEDRQACKFLDFGNNIPANVIIFVGLHKFCKSRTTLGLELIRLTNILGEILHFQVSRQLEPSSFILQSLSEKLGISR